MVNRFEPNGQPAAAQQPVPPWNPMSPSAAGFAPQPFPTPPATAPHVSTNLVPAAAAIPAPQNMALVPGVGTPPAVQQEADDWHTPQAVTRRYREYEAHRGDMLLASIGTLNAGLM
ncbi:MAG TPA: hypothetical protein VG125_26265, partial [Pirellulales bacterium]|nr:hypothetical protein [Pirellulales bacterium]